MVSKSPSLLTYKLLRDSVVQITKNLKEGFSIALLEKFKNRLVAQEKYKETFVGSLAQIKTHILKVSG